MTPRATTSTATAAARTAASPGVVILNDTATESHHGCSRVMMVLRDGLAAEGISVRASLGTGQRWWKDSSFMAALAEADGIIINGEGTLHHGRPRAEALLKIATHPAARAPLFLVNTLYQENPPQWAAYLDRFSAIYARDRRSAAEISAVSHRKARAVPDLTLCRGSLAEPATRREGVLIGDSVDREIAARLAMASDAPGRDLVPILARPRSVKGKSRLRRTLRRLTAMRLARALKARHPHYRPAPTADDYAAALRASVLHVTGRFHGVCFSLLTETPFVAVASNSWKTEALLAEIGLSGERLLGVDAAVGAAAEAPAHAFSDTDRTAIAAYLAKAQDEAAGMFAEIGQTVRAYSQRG